VSQDEPVFRYIATFKHLFHVKLYYLEFTTAISSVLITIVAETGKLQFMKEFLFFFLENFFIIKQIAAEDLCQLFFPSWKSQQDNCILGTFLC
jgi:hypothetical protein